MQDILDHINTQLNTISGVNTVEQNREQVATIDVGAVTLPAAYYDVVNMAYTQTGDKGYLAETEVKIIVACAFDDATMYQTINDIKQTLCKVESTNYSPLILKSVTRVANSAVWEYHIVFVTSYFDTAAQKSYTTLSKDNVDLSFTSSMTTTL